jgi:hypothetical protein
MTSETEESTQRKYGWAVRCASLFTKSAKSVMGVFDHRKSLSRAAFRKVFVCLLFRFVLESCYHSAERSCRSAPPEKIS